MKTKQPTAEAAFAWVDKHKPFIESYRADYDNLQWDVCPYIDPHGMDEKYSGIYTDVSLLKAIRKAMKASVKK